MKETVAFASIDFYAQYRSSPVIFQSAFNNKIVNEKIIQQKSGIIFFCLIDLPLINYKNKHAV